MKRSIEIVLASFVIVAGICAIVFIQPKVSVAKADMPDAVAPNPFKAFQVAQPLFERVPVSVPVISGFGEPRSQNRKHEGADFGAIKGEDVIAVAAGKAMLYENHGFACVRVVHEGVPGVKATSYCELQVEVPVGVLVKAGQKIGTVSGRDGNFAQHIHFEVIDASGKKIDPCQPQLMKCSFLGKHR